MFRRNLENPQHGPDAAHCENFSHDVCFHGGYCPSCNDPEENVEHLRNYLHPAGTKAKIVEYFYNGL